MAKRTIGVDLFDIRNMYVGVGEFSFRLGERLALRAPELKKNHDIELLFFVPPKFKGAFGNQVSYKTVGTTGRLFSWLTFRRIDLFHSVHQFARIKVPFSVRKRVLTIHDLNFLYEKSESKKRKYFRIIRRKISKADFINFISGFVEQDVKSHYEIGCPTEVIYNGVTDLAAIAEQHKDILQDRDYLFHISGISPKKNVHLLVEMMRFLPDERLVIAGNPRSAYAARLSKRISELGLENVDLIGNVDLTTKAVLYRNCKAFLFPSLCEGFGLPPVEAMYFGKPVFLSTLSSLPEVGGQTAYYWPSLEPEDMAQVLKKYLSTPDPARTPEAIRLWAGNFTWEKCADRYIELYLKVMNLPAASDRGINKQ